MNPLTSSIERERREAEARAIEVSQSELTKQLDRLDAEKEGARVAARLREKEIRETVARTARRVRNDLAAELYGALRPLVQAMIAEPKRETTRAIVAVWQSFRHRCKTETGRDLDGRPVTNIMIGELAPGIEANVFTRAFDMALGYSLIANLEGALTTSLADGFNLGEVARAFEAIEAEIQRLAKEQALTSPNAKTSPRWEATKTALSSTDAAQLLAAMDPARPEPPPPAAPGLMLGSEPGYKPSETERAAFRAAARARAAGAP